MFGCVCCGVPTHVYTGAVQDNACQQWFGPTSLLHVPEGVLTLHVLTLHVLTLHVLTHHVHTYICTYVVHIWTDKLASCLHTPLLFPFFSLILLYSLPLPPSVHACVRRKNV